MKLPQHALLCLGLLLVPAGARAQDTLSTTAPGCAPAGVPLESPFDPRAELLIPAARTAGALEPGPGFVRRPSALRGAGYCAASGTDAAAAAGHGPILTVLPVRLRTFVNSGYPSDANNGAVWAGRGLSTAVSGGIAGRWGALSLALAPDLAYQQNRAFGLRAPGGQVSPFANPYYPTIDLPQRFGPDAFWTAGPGQSYARLDGRGAAAGVSTENLWWGPGSRYSLLMSTTGPGFPHVFLGTSGPVDVRIGHLETEVVWGRLTRSDYVPDATPDASTFVGVTLAFETPAIPGLSLGLARVYLLSADSLSVRDHFPFLEPFLKNRLATPDNPGGNSPDNQLIALYARWILPDSDFRVYAEWGRDDHAWDFRDLATEPDHSQAYLLGFEKLLPAGPNLVRLGGELIHLQEQRQRSASRPTPIWYTHGRYPYSHRGQALGSATGPGSDAQFVAADLLADWGSAGVFLERVRRNDFSGPARQARERWPLEHDVELTAGLRQLLTSRAVDVSVLLAYSYRYHRDFLDDDDNLRFDLNLAWRPLAGRPGRGRPLDVSAIRARLGYD